MVMVEEERETPQSLEILKLQFVYSSLSPLPSIGWVRCLICLFSCVSSSVSRITKQIFSVETLVCRQAS